MEAGGVDIVILGGGWQVKVDGSGRPQVLRQMTQGRPPLRRMTRGRLTQWRMAPSAVHKKKEQAVALLTI